MVGKNLILKQCLDHKKLSKTTSKDVTDTQPNEKLNSEKWYQRKCNGAEGKDKEGNT